MPKPFYVDSDIHWRFHETKGDDYYLMGIVNKSRMIKIRGTPENFDDPDLPDKHLRAILGLVDRVFNERIFNA